MSEEQFRARVGRRGFLRGAGVGAAGIAAAALIGCGDSDAVSYTHLTLPTTPYV